MASRVWLVLSVLAVASSVCCSESEVEVISKDLFDKIQVKKIRAPSAAISALEKGQLSNEEVFTSLVEANRAKIGELRGREYADWVHLASDECGKISIEKKRDTCKGTKIANLISFCNFVADQQIEFCKENKDRALADFVWGQRFKISLLLWNVESFKNELDKNVASEEGAKKSREDNMRDVCMQLGYHKGKWSLADANSVIRLLDEELAYLGYTSEDLVREIKAKIEGANDELVVKFSGSVEELTALSRAIVKECNSFKLSLRNNVLGFADNVINTARDIINYSP